MNPDDDIMAGTVADSSTSATTAHTLPAPPPPSSSAAAAAATAAGSDEPAAASTSTSTADAPPSASPAPATSGWGDLDGSGAAGSSASAQPPAQTEAQKREERRKKSLGVDEKKRGKRLFGGLLSTLDAFKKEERKREGSDAAKRRTQIATRIQTKLRSETVITGELADKERALRLARAELERLESELQTKSNAYATRHTTMRRLSGFLFTPIAASPSAHAEGAAIRGSASISKAIFDLPSPVPLSQAAKLQAVPPLFFLPKELTTEQDERLAKQKLEVNDLILREDTEWAASRSELETAAAAAKEKLVELTGEVRELRSQKASFTPTPIVAPAAMAKPEPSPSAASDGRGEPGKSEQVVQVKDEEMRDVESTTAAAAADDGWDMPAAVATGVDGEEVEY